MFCPLFIHFVRSPVHPSPPPTRKFHCRTSLPPREPTGPIVMPNGKLETDEAAINPVIAEVRDDANPTDFLMLGE